MPRRRSKTPVSRRRSTRLVPVPPDPVPPEQVSPDPVSPDPVSPELVTPEPVAPVSSKPVPPKSRALRLSRWYGCSVLLCAVVNALAIDVYGRACGLGRGTFLDMARSLATAGSPLCTGLATITGGLGSVYAQIWKHVAGIAVLRVGEALVSYK